MVGAENKTPISQAMHNFIRPFDIYGPGDLKELRELNNKQEGVISQFTSATDNKPKSEPFCFYRLPTDLLVHRICSSKVDAPLFSLNSYKTGAKRGADGVDEVFAFMVDIDDVPPGFYTQLLLDAFADCPATVYSTFSSTETAPKLRLIVFLAWPCPASLYKELWTILAARLPVKVDPAPSSPASIFYVPSCPVGTAPILLTQCIEHGRITEAPFDWINYLQDHGRVDDSTPVKPANVATRFQKSNLYETPNAALVARRCAVIRNAYETGGADDSEPLWFGILKVCAAMEPDISVEVSDGHAKFTMDELVDRMDRIEREGLKPATCTYIGQHSTECSTCEWASLKRSPVALGYEHLPAKNKQGVPA